MTPLVSILKLSAQVNKLEHSDRHKDPLTETFSYINNKALLHSILRGVMYTVQGIPIFKDSKELLAYFKDYPEGIDFRSTEIPNGVIGLVKWVDPKNKLIRIEHQPPHKLPFIKEENLIYYYTLDQIDSLIQINAILINQVKGN